MWKAHHIDSASFSLAVLVFCLSLLVHILVQDLIGDYSSYCMHGSSGCLGCYHKPTLITTVDEQSKGPNVKCETVKKPSISEEFWTTSTCDMENSALQSQGSISSISIANQTLDQHGGPDSINNVSEFVNHGLLLWNQTRHCWVGNKRSGNQELLPQEPKLNWNATYESLLGSNKAFPQPIPLTEMVDFLVDIWEQEGMYD